MIEILLYAVISAACFSAGVFLGKKDKRMHLPVLGIILLLVAIKIISTHTALLFPPFSWFIGGRNSDLFTLFCALIIFGAGYGSLKVRRKRIALALFSALVTSFYALYPEFYTLFLQNNLLKLEGNIYKDGICFQTSKYSCGPASAVMLLDSFGIRTNEAEMARLSETNNLTGTHMDKLASAVSLKIKPLGLKAVYEKTDYEKLKPFLKPFSIKIKRRFMVDHYVVVFDVKDGEVVVGDPLEGREVCSRKEFPKKWRRVVLRVHKNNPTQTEGSLKIA